MAQVTRNIGLSLGADLCWPICYEEIVRRLDLEVKVGKDRVRFDVERVTIEPFDLRQETKYDVVLDRLTHWYTTSREWIKKAVLMDGVYVLNNPWAIQSMEKQSTYCAMMALGFPIPDTWMVPPKEYEQTPDLQPTLERYAKLFNLGEIGDKVGYPLFIKPYDGGAWVAVTKVDDAEQLHAAYDQSGKRVMHLQAGVKDFDLFVRCIGIGPQFRMVRYDPSAPLHDRYRMTPPDMTEAEQRTLRNMTLTINTFFGWDFNSCEALRKDGVFYPIDFANACPDSQVTSLHYHFPWLVKSKIRWSLFVAATKRKMRRCLDWEPFYEIAATGASFEDKLEGYAKLGEKILELDRFEEFCAKQLGHLDEVADEFFGSERAKQAVRLKVAALFPEHEIDEFTELFWERIQHWRRVEGG